MDIEIDAAAKDKRLNRMVALTVVTLSIFMGLSQVKDGNIVQAMAQAQSNAVDRWGEYQATKTKLHIDEVAMAQSRFLAGLGGAKVAEPRPPSRPGSPRRWRSTRKRPRNCGRWPRNFRRNTTR